LAKKHYLQISVIYSRLFDSDYRSELANRLIYDLQNLGFLCILKCYKNTSLYIHAIDIKKEHPKILIRISNHAPLRRYKGYRIDPKKNTLPLLRIHLLRRLKNTFVKINN
jgi:hypothetical protein